MWHGHAGMLLGTPCHHSSPRRGFAPQVVVPGALHDHRALRAFAQYVHEGRVDLTPAVALPLFVAASQLGLPDLRSLSSQYLIAKCVNKDNAPLLHSLAGVYKAQRLLRFTAVRSCLLLCGRHASHPIHQVVHAPLPPPSTATHFHI